MPPMLMTQMPPEFQEIAPIATSMVATCVIITSVMVPILTAFNVKKAKQNKPVVNEVESDEITQGVTQ